MPQPESPWAKSSYDDYDYTVSLDTQTRILQGDALALEAIRNLHLDENRALASALAVAAPKPSTLTLRSVDRDREAALIGAFHGAR